MLYHFCTNLDVEEDECCSVLYLGVLVFLLYHFHTNLNVEEDEQVGVFCVVPGCSCLCAVSVLF